MVQQMPCPEIFYTYEWAIAVQRAYSASLRPFLVLGYERDSLLGVAALASDTAEPRHLTFLASTTADYCDFLSLPHIGREWCQSVFDELHKHDVSSVTLANLPADSSTASVLSEAAAAHGFHTFMRPAYGCARILLGSGQDREFLRRKITGKKMLRRNLNAMNKSSAVAFSPCVTDHLDSALPQFFKAHVTRFLASGRMSNLVRQERRNFLSELARELSPRGWLALSQLLVEGKPVAWNYGFQFGGSWFWYQPTFDTKFDNFSPGFCLLSKLIEAACDTPSVTRVDLGLGAEGYKERFATETRKTLHVSLRRSKISCAKAKLRYRAAEVSKISPVVERKLRSLTGQFTRVRSSVRKRHVSGISRLLVRRVLGRFFGDSAILFYQWPSHSAANALPGALRPRWSITKILKRWPTYCALRNVCKKAKPMLLLS
jgi:CelD/BcsL family acetyltransferase involved in cellulose biosynthesis